MMKSGVGREKGNGERGKKIGKEVKRIRSWEDKKIRILNFSISKPLIFCFLLFTILTACSGPQDKQPTARVGAAAPAFTLTLANGGSITLDSFKGKSLVITFMASWCPCSNESAPVFKEAYSKYNPKGVEFLMIGIQDSESKFKKFVDKKQFLFPAGFDKGDKIARLYGVNAPPTTFFIDQAGKIARAYYGKVVELEKLSAWVDEIAK